MSRLGTKYRDSQLILALPKMHLRTFRIATQAVGHVSAVQVLPAAEHADRQEAGRGGRLLRIGRLSGRPPAGTNDSTICFPCLLIKQHSLLWKICFMAAEVTILVLNLRLKWLSHYYVVSG